MLKRLIILTIIFSGFATKAYCASSLPVTLSAPMTAANEIIINGGQLTSDITLPDGELNTTMTPGFIYESNTGQDKQLELTASVLIGPTTSTNALVNNGLTPPAANIATSWLIMGHTLNSDLISSSYPDQTAINNIIAGSGTSPKAIAYKITVTGLNIKSPQTDQPTVTFQNTSVVGPRFYINPSKKNIYVNTSIYNPVKTGSFEMGLDPSGRYETTITLTYAST
jgi:hypothetical protein